MWKLLLCILLPIASHAQFLGGAEAGNFEAQYKASDDMMVDTSMTIDMTVAAGATYQINPLKNLNEKVREAKLRRHLKKYLGEKPISFRLLNKRAKKLEETAFRAIVKTAEGDKLRGFWRKVEYKEYLESKDLLTLSYDEALRRRGTSGTTVNFEVQLPPIGGHCPSVVYSLVLGTGSSVREATVCKSPSVVKIHPKGLEGKGFKVGSTFISSPSKAGVVDASWAKGRTIFRSGQSIGKV